MLAATAAAAICVVSCKVDGGGGVEDEQRKQFTANGRFKSLLTRSISFLAVLVVLRIFSIWLTGIFLF